METGIIFAWLARTTGVTSNIPQISILRHTGAGLEFGFSSMAL